MVMKIKEHTEEDSISMGEFRQFLERQLDNWSEAYDADTGVEQWCNETYEDSSAIYKGAQVWKDMFFRYYGLTQEVKFLKN